MDHRTRTPAGGKPCLKQDIITYQRRPVITVAASWAETTETTHCSEDLSLLWQFRGQTHHFREFVRTTNSFEKDPKREKTILYPGRHDWRYSSWWRSKIPHSIRIKWWPKRNDNQADTQLETRETIAIVKLMKANRRRMKSNYMNMDETITKTQDLGNLWRVQQAWSHRAEQHLRKEICTIWGMIWKWSTWQAGTSLIIPVSLVDVW